MDVGENCPGDVDRKLCAADRKSGLASSSRRDFSDKVETRSGSVKPRARIETSDVSVHTQGAACATPSRTTSPPTALPTATCSVTVPWAPPFTAVRAPSVSTSTSTRSGRGGPPPPGFGAIRETWRRCVRRWPRAIIGEPTNSPGRCSRTAGCRRSSPSDGSSGSTIGPRAARSRRRTGAASTCPPQSRSPTPAPLSGSRPSYPLSTTCSSPAPTARRPPRRFCAAHTPCVRRRPHSRGSPG